MSVFFLDECHLLWGDICGYVWGNRQERIEVPVINERQKQTYYGALKLYTQKFLIKAYDKGNSQSTIGFLEYLRSHCPQSRIALIWDGASYHRSQEVKTYARIGQSTVGAVGLEDHLYSLCSKCTATEPD